MSWNRPPRLLIRADAGEKIGSGHVMRCLALALAWRNSGGAVALVGEALPSALAARFVEEKIAVNILTDEPGSTADAKRTAALARGSNADWLVLDGYKFRADYQRAVAQAGTRVLVNDDFGCLGDYACDLILDQNLGARESSYARRETATQLLLGSRFVLLRSEFLRCRPALRETSVQARRILVTLGGADAENVTLKVLEALTGLDAEIVAVIGPANVHGAALEACARQSAGRIRLRHNATDMPELMTWADLAVSAAGTTAWELSFMGLPHLLIVLAENQRESARMLDAAGAARNLGWHRDLQAEAIRAEVLRLLGNRELRAAMSARAAQVVDGQGASRVVTEMKSRLFTVRRAQNADCRQVFEWANEPATRAASFSSEPIPWENHAAWFARKLHDLNCAFYFALDAQQRPVAQVRFDTEDREATISVSVDARARGGGTGSAVILAACREFFKTSHAETVSAFIKPENQPSLRAFARAGFEPAASDPSVARLTLFRKGE